MDGSGESEAQLTSDARRLNCWDQVSRAREPPRSSDGAAEPGNELEEPRRAVSLSVCCEAPPFVQGLVKWVRSFRIRRQGSTPVRGGGATARQSSLTRAAARNSPIIRAPTEVSERTLELTAPPFRHGRRLSPAASHDALQYTTTARWRRRRAQLGSAELGGGSRRPSSKELKSGASASPRRARSTSSRRRCRR